NYTGNIKKNELRPHKNSYWCIPPKENAEFVACIQWQFTADNARTKLVSLYPKFDVVAEK
ncbi:MAG: hypothetical protein NC307_10620, partial [Roseburia sp.]|nr:hypothetical protein [Roseburia sp.]